MRTLSASIVIAVGIASLCVAAFVPTPDFRTYIVVGFGCLISLIGLFGWFVSLVPRDIRMRRYDDDEDEEYT